MAQSIGMLARIVPVLLVLSFSTISTSSMAQGLKVDSSNQDSNESVLNSQLKTLRGELNKIQLQMDEISKQLKKRNKTTKVDVKNRLNSKSEPVGQKPAKRVNTAMERKARMDAQKLYDEAYTLYLDSQYESAKGKFKAFLKQFPNDRLTVSAQVWLAEVYRKLGDDDRAEEYFRKAQELQVAQGDPITSSRSSGFQSENRSAVKVDPYLRAQRDRKKVHDKHSSPSQLDLYENAAAGSSEDFIVNVGDRVFFETDSSELSDHAYVILGSQVDWLHKFSNVSLLVEGHADERGTREYNLALGAARSEAVKQFLIREGINQTRIQTISYGKERPVAVCDNISCWAQNRRAVILLENGAATTPSKNPVIIRNQERFGDEDALDKDLNMSQDGTSGGNNSAKFSNVGYPVTQR